MIINTKTKIINENQLKRILKNCDKDMKEAVRLAFYNGYPLRKIESEMKLKRRFLQHKIQVASMKALGFEVSFSQLRSSCVIYLFKKGNTPKDITKIMGYTKIKNKEKIK